MKSGIRSCTLEVERDGRRHVLVVQEFTQIRELDIESGSFSEWDGELDAGETGCVHMTMIFTKQDVTSHGARVRSVRTWITRGDRRIPLIVDRPEWWIYDMGTGLAWNAPLTRAEAHQASKLLATAEA